MRCGSRTHHTFKAAVSDENPSYGGPAQDASIPQRAIARDLRRPRHKHTVPVARDLEVLAAEDHTTTIDTVDGDITIMRIQLLTVVSLLLLSPRGTPRRPENRTIAFALLAPMPGTSTSATNRRRTIGPGCGSPDDRYRPVARAWGDQVSSAVGAGTV